MGASSFDQGQTVFLKRTFYTLARKVSDDLWQLEETRSKRIIECTTAQLRTWYSEGELTFVNDAWSHVNPTTVGGCIHHEVDPEAWEAAKVRRMYVQEILKLPGTREIISPVIRAVWEKLKAPAKVPDCATVLRWKRKYLSAGEDIHALVEQNHKKGNRVPRFPEEVCVIAEQAVETVYLTRERNTVQDTLDKALFAVNTENKQRPVGTQLPLPSRRLVERTIARRPAFERHVARYGYISAKRHFRAVLGHRTTDTPLERAEIDHTRLDLFVVDDTTGMPLGRPWVTACIDDFTRCILGIHVGFEPPSYVTVGRCLKHAFLPKTDLRNSYPNIKNEWSAHGVPRELVVDNGLEFHSTSLERACFSLGIEIHYSPRKTPWFKGKIERYFGTLNRAIAHGTPGTTFSNIVEKDDYNPAKHAVVRLSALQEIIRLWIVDVYHQKPHRSLDAPPAAVWNTNVDTAQILLPDNPAEIDAVLARVEERTLTHKGIELDCLVYCSPELKALRSQYGEELKVEVRTDASDLGHIWVLMPDKSQLLKVPALNQAYAKGLTKWQHTMCKNFAKKKLDKYDSVGWLEAKQKIAELVEQEVLNKKRTTRVRETRHSATKVIADAMYQAQEAAPQAEDVAAGMSTSETPETAPPAADTTTASAVSNSGSVALPPPRVRYRKSTDDNA